LIWKLHVIAIHLDR